MKLAVQPTHHSHMKRLARSGADYFVVGVEGYAQRMRNTVPFDKLKAYNDAALKLDRRLFVSMNALLFDASLNDVEAIMKDVAAMESVEGIMVADIGAIYIAERLGIKNKIVYYAETAPTSDQDVAFFEAEGLRGVVLARELTIESIETIAKAVSIPLFHIGHGHLNMFHSRRRLITNYFKKTNQHEATDKKGYTITEETRQEAYPIQEDKHGTHVFRNSPTHAFSVLNRLKDILDVMIVDRLFMDDKTTETLIADYRKSIDEGVSPTLLKQYESTHDSGFFHRRTLMKKDGEPK